MKNTIYIIIIFICCSVTFGQIDKFKSYSDKLLNKVQVGMSVDEVKKILGRPKTIEGGFPLSDYDYNIVFDTPRFVSQINNSTWCYFYSPLLVKFDQKLNGVSVSSELFREYDTTSVVYSREDEIISPIMAKSYKLLNDHKLKTVKKILSDNSKTEKISLFFVPLLCVIYDRGTQVVASVKVLFLLQKQ